MRRLSKTGLSVELAGAGEVCVRFFFLYRETVIEQTIGPEAVADRVDDANGNYTESLASRRNIPTTIRRESHGGSVYRERRVRRGGHPCSSFPFGRDRPIGDGRTDVRTEGRKEGVRGETEWEVGWCSRAEGLGRGMLREAAGG